MPRSFLRPGLPAGGELGHRAAGSRLRGLAARVGVDLRIEHQEVDVAAGGEDVVHAAETDVVGPAVAAEAPHAAADQVIGRGRQVLRIAAADGRQPLLERRHQRPLQGDLGVGLLLVVDQGLDDLVAQLAAELGQQRVAILQLLVDRQAEAHAELGTVLEQRVRPGRALALGRLRVGRAGQVAAVDRRAARGVADQHAIAEQLRDELDVGRLAATGAGPGELEQRQQELRALDRVELDLGPIDVGDREEEVPAGPLALEIAGSWAPCRSPCA